MCPSLLDPLEQPENEKGDWVEELRPGQTVRGLFAVGRSGVRKTRTGKAFLTLELTDRTGTLKGVGWDLAALAPRLEAGCVVHVTGRVEQYQAETQIKLEEVTPVPGPVSSEFFIADGPQEREHLAERLERVRAGIATPYLKELLDRLFDDRDLLEAYLTFPAAKLRHHAYRGGLAEHSLNMAEHARYCAGFYPELDGDLLVVSALLHDIGKIREYRMDVMIDYSEPGRMEGHVVLGDRMVRRITDAIPEFPEEIRCHLSHLILSHQGRLEHASPVTPKSLEGVVLHALDLLDSRVATWRDIRARSEPGRRWSDFDRLDGQFWFLGDTPAEDSGEE